MIRLGARSTLVALALAVIACTTPPAPTVAPAGPSVDVLTYLIGDTSLWPRSGRHGQNQIVDVARREVCWVKYGNPRRFECWRWDDQFIYHAVDHGLDGDSNESYMFTDGRWLARFIPAGATAGPDHRKQFEIEVGVRGERLASATGASKKEAEQEAARAALEKLRTENS